MGGVDSTQQWPFTSVSSSSNPELSSPVCKRALSSESTSLLPLLTGREDIVAFVGTTCHIKPHLPLPIHSLTTSSPGSQAAGSVFTTLLLVGTTCHVKPHPLLPVHSLITPSQGSPAAKSLFTTSLLVVRSTHRVDPGFPPHHLNLELPIKQISNPHYITPRAKPIPILPSPFSHSPP